MLRLVAMILVIAAGAVAGGLTGLIGGAAFLESGRSACEAASCADTIVRSFVPAGAVIGALIGIGKARSMRAGQA